jgi:hypothetical protein
MNDLFSDIPPELWLVLAFAGGDVAKVQNILQQPINWELFLQLVVHHRVYPLVYKIINQLNNPAVPPSVVSRLRQIYRENVVQAISLAGETVRISQCFESHGIRVLVLKGAPLALRLYGDIAGRPSRDIDILVDPGQIAEAQEVLKKQGYCNALELTPRQLQILYRGDNLSHFVYEHSEKDIILELHRELGFALAMLAERAIQRLEVAGSAVSVLSDEKWLLYLMLHGARHAWFRLRWLVDIARFIEVGGLDWASLKRMMESSGTQIAFHQGLILAERLLGAPIPPGIQTDLQHNPAAWRSACMAMKVCLATAESEIRGSVGLRAKYLFGVYRIQAQAGWKNKFNYILHLFRPHLEDIKLVALPDWLYPLYYVIRLFTWFGRRMRRLFS